VSADPHNIFFVLAFREFDRRNSHPALGRHKYYIANTPFSCSDLYFSVVLLVVVVHFDIFVLGLIFYILTHYKKIMKQKPILETKNN